MEPRCPTAPRHHYTVIQQVSMVSSNAPPSFFFSSYSSSLLEVFLKQNGKNQKNKKPKRKKKQEKEKRMERRKMAVIFHGAMCSSSVFHSIVRADETAVGVLFRKKNRARKYTLNSSAIRPVRMKTNYVPYLDLSFLMSSSCIR